MRTLFIALVALVTALTFYSALWFKSVNIEEDITARVTDDMSETDAKDIAIDVDGRHVTLTGVVFDEAAEASYLDVANDTYGALGPIDGLTYQADGGYVAATKDADGITLKGTVPNEDVRATLVSNAQAATDGAVEDQLMISGPVADWQGEAALGVSQLAGLTSGSMNAADGTYSLSGLAAANPADVTGALDGRDGWQSFVSAPSSYIAAIKDADGITLKGTVASEEARAEMVANAQAATDGTVADELMVSGPSADWQNEANFGIMQLSGLTSGAMNAADGTFSLSGVTNDDPATLNGVLEGRAGWQSFVSSPVGEQALSANVARLKTDLSRASSEAGANKAQATALRNRLGMLSTERDGVSAELDSLKASLTEDQSTREALRGELTASQESLTGAQAMIAEKDQIIADNTGVIEGLNTRIGGLETDVANVTEELGTVSDINAELSGVILERNDTIEAMRNSASDSESDQIVALNGVITDRDRTIDALNGQLGDRDIEIARLSGEVETRDGSLAKTAAEIAALTALTQSNGDEASTLGAQVADLTADVAERDQTIAALTGEVADVKGEAAQTQADLTALKAAMQDTDANASGLQAKVADLTTDVAERDQTIAALNTNVADLTAVVAERDAALAAKPAVTSVSNTLGAQQCATQAGTVMENSRINFATGTARIDNDSVELLERMTGIALACVNEGLTVEVGGHTDSQGSDENNQTLSEARAAAIVAFMSERGVPTDGLAAVGYGESQPIADNDTSEGRAQNRRISFDWQAR